MLIVLGIAYAVVLCVGGTWLFRCGLLTLMFVWGWFYLHLLVVCLFGCLCLMEWVACGLVVMNIGCGAVVAIVTPLCSITWFCCLF